MEIPILCENSPKESPPCFYEDAHKKAIPQIAMMASVRQGWKMR